LFVKVTMSDVVSRTAAGAPSHPCPVLPSAMPGARVKGGAKVLTGAELALALEASQERLRQGPQDLTIRWLVRTERVSTHPSRRATPAHRKSGLGSGWLGRDQSSASIVSIPRMEDLHRRLALELIKKPSFSGKEIRFLRKHLGWSQAQFAEHVAVEKETISRWETGALEMGDSMAQLLRLLVFMGEKVQDYEKAGEPRSGKENLSLSASDAGWAPRSPPSRSKPRQKASAAVASPWYADSTSVPSVVSWHWLRPPGGIP
jgi:DNA-binding transcriptional regulator YiaG